MKILIRADGSKEIGTGHIMRTLAMAQTFQDMGSEVTFLCVKLPQKLEELLEKEDTKLVQFYDDTIGSHQDAEITAAIAHFLDIDWVIADGYLFDSKFQKTLKEQGIKQMLVDDYGHASSYYADIVLNPGINPNPNFYLNKDDDTQLLLGPDYTPLRREFLITPRCQKEITPAGNKVLVTMGGSDPRQMTLKVVDSLKEKASELQIAVVAGPLSSYLEPLSVARSGSESQILLLDDVSNMADLMSWADIGISAGGTTLGEMAYMGLPNLIIKTAPNQSCSMFYETRFGTSVYLGDAETITTKQIRQEVLSLLGDDFQRQVMSENGNRLIDGKGSKRIYDTLLQFSFSSAKETK